MNHCKTIAIVNQKGGVGKTTSTVNLGVGLAQAGNRVLLVDDDPQHSLTISLGIRNADEDLDTTLATAMQAEIRDESVPWEEGILHSDEGVDLLPANIELSGVEMSLFNAMSREQVLKSVLSRVKENYDYILIDCMVLLKENTHPNEDGFSPMVIDGHTLTEKKAAGTALLDACNTMTGTNPIPLGSYRGFQMTLCFDSFEKLFKISLQGALTYKVSLGTDVFGNIQRIDNLLESMPTQQIEYKEKLKNLEIQVENAKQEIAMPFPREEELKEKAARLDQLNILLNMDKRENEIVDGIQDEGEIQPQRESRDWER